jgi:eukaryotic-like serine/threonine-protein kinase
VHGPRKSQVIGRYLLHDEIASGGMATVHVARVMGPAGFSRTVAIKRLHAQYAKDPEFVSMFLDEARLAARIHHPNVVSTIDVVARDGELFLVMEYVAGEALSRLLSAARHSRRIPLPVALSVMTHTLYGLHAAHEAKSQHGEPLAIVHRDVSPQNVLVGVDGVARVLDFGVAKAAIRLQSTRDGQIKGKLRYMAPEQIQMRGVDRRADVYAVACVLWEALTGEKLFAAEDPGAVVNLILRGTVSPPSSVVADLPAELDAVVLRGLATDPRKRFPSALAMADELERFGLATTRAVGAWVERTCGDVLEARAARVAAIEGSNESGALRAAPHSAFGMEEMSSSPPRMPAPSQLETEPDHEAALTPNVPPIPRRGGIDSTSPGAAIAADVRGRPRIGWLATTLGLVSLGVLLTSATIVRRTRVEPQAPSATPWASPSSSGATADTSKAESTPSATESRAPAPPPTAVSSPANSAPRPGVPPAKKRGCDPPFTIVDGIKTFKPACL